MELMLPVFMPAKQDRLGTRMWVEVGVESEDSTLRLGGETEGVCSRASILSL